MTTRTRAVVAVAAAAVTAAGALALTTTHRARTPAERARAEARDACRDAETFESQVARNARIDDARATIAKALRHAQVAVELDPQWTQLQSGIETLQLSIERDDAGAANVGVRVVRAACRTVR